MGVSVATLAAKSLRFLGKFSSFDQETWLEFLMCVLYDEDVGRSSLWRQRMREGEMFCVTG